MAPIRTLAAVALAAVALAAVALGAGELAVGAVADGAVADGASAASQPAARSTVVMAVVKRRMGTDNVAGRAMSTSADRGSGGLRIERPGEDGDLCLLGKGSAARPGKAGPKGMRGARILMNGNGDYTAAFCP
jgi:hypothetical protein